MLLREQGVFDFIAAHVTGERGDEVHKDVISPSRFRGVSFEFRAVRGSKGRTVDQLVMVVEVDGASDDLAAFGPVLHIELQALAAPMNVDGRIPFKSVRKIAFVKVHVLRAHDEDARVEAPGAKREVSFLVPAKVVVMLAEDEEGRSNGMLCGTGFGGALKFDNKTLDEEHEYVVKLAADAVPPNADQVDVLLRGEVPLRDLAGV